jgi:hypothetical protein
MQPATALDHAAHYRAHGWIDLGRILGDEEVGRFAEHFDRNRRDFPTWWRTHGNPETTLTADPLVTTPEFDALVRHPRIVAAVSAALGGTARFWEVSLRHIGPMGGRALADGWHRDFAVDQGFAVAQAMVYLTDTDAATSCLAVVPRGEHEPPLDRWVEEDRRHRHLECVGRAGTVWIFNPLCWHTARYRGDAERKSVQTYYRIAERPMALANSPHCVVPRRFWDGSDREAAEFYRFAPEGQRTAMMGSALR